METSSGTHIGKENQIKTKFIQSEFESQAKTPPLSRHDSLVLSVTAQKMQSPYQSDLLKDSYQYVNYNLTQRTNGMKDSYQNVKGLNFLGQRLEILQGKIQSIKTQRVSTQSQIYEGQTCDVPQFDKQNDKNIINAQNQNSQKFIVKSGCFVKKNRRNKVQDNSSFNSNSQYHVTRKNSTSRRSEKSINNYIRNISKDQDKIKGNISFCGANKTYCTPTNSMKNMAEKFSSTSKKQIGTLKTRINQLERKADKSQRSKSLFARKLSQTKRGLSLAQRQSKNNNHKIKQLQRKLKKSQNIRNKQKQTIFKQKKQIEQLNRTLRQIQRQVVHQ